MALESEAATSTSSGHARTPQRPRRESTREVLPEATSPEVGQPGADGYAQAGAQTGVLATRPKRASASSGAQVIERPGKLKYALSCLCKHFPRSNVALLPKTRR